MLKLSEILKFYPPELQTFKRFVLREYLQHKILEIVFESDYATQLSFMGGTCLRIIHNNRRFSEDLDFDNTNLSQNDFNRLAQIIKKELMRSGYETEMKNVHSGAYHCRIKFPKFLYDEGLSGYETEKILIQLDTEPQNFNYKPENHILNKFDIFTGIRTVPKDILLAQKFYAVLNRPRKKGRDFYDIIFLMQDSRPNYNYLQQKVQIKTETELKEKINKELEKTDLNVMAQDVKPFLFKPEEIKKIQMFKAFFNQETNRK